MQRCESKRLFWKRAQHKASDGEYANAAACCGAAGLLLLSLCYVAQRAFGSRWAVTYVIAAAECCKSLLQPNIRSMKSSPRARIEFTLLCLSFVSLQSACFPTESNKTSWSIWGEIEFLCSTLSCGLDDPWFLDFYPSLHRFIKTSCHPPHEMFWFLDLLSAPLWSKTDLITHLICSSWLWLSVCLCSTSWPQAIPVLTAAVWVDTQKMSKHPSSRGSLLTGSITWCNRRPFLRFYK